MTVEELTTLIQGEIKDAQVFARDLTGTGDHFEAFIVSAQFSGKSRVVRQQLVMAALAEPLRGPLHALTMKTFTPEEWDAQTT